MEKKKIIIGRDSNCDIVFKDSSVSRKHSQMIISKEIKLKDLNSSNGTKIIRNNKRYKLDKGEEIIVDRNDVIKFGNYKTTVKNIIKILDKNRKEENNIKREKNSKKDKSKSKECQFCREKIKKTAEVCPYCQREQLKRDEYQRMLKKLVPKVLYIIFTFIIVFIGGIQNGWLIKIILILLGVPGISKLFGIYLEDKYSKLEILKLFKKKQKTKRRILQFISLVIFSAILFCFAMFLTNPTEIEFKNYVNRNYSGIRYQTEYINLGLFSIGGVEVMGGSSEYGISNTRISCVGVFNRFYEIGREEENLIEWWKRQDE